MSGSKKEYHFGAIEDILRESGAEAAEPDRTEEMDGGILLTSGIHVYLPYQGINVHEGYFCCMEDGQLVPLKFLTVIYDRTDKEYLYDAEENFIDTVHEWLKGRCTLEQLEQEPCEIKGIREERMRKQKFENGKGDLDGKGIQTGGGGRNPCGDGTACRSAGRHLGKR